jgi:serine/threonine protein kinase
MSALVEMPMMKRERRASDVTLKDISECTEYLPNPVLPRHDVKKEGYVIYTDALLGEGSYSSVFEAEDVATRKCAVAKLTDVSRKTHSHCHFNEVASFKRLEPGHPNIVRYFDDFVQNDVGIIIMEKLPSQTLEDHIAVHGRMDPLLALEIFNQIVSAVVFMHDHNLSPRDLKTENIAFDPLTNIAKIFDFGLAMQLYPNPDGTMPLVNVTTGSPLYMAPEVVAVKPHDSFAHDIWCLGQIFYMMLVGHSPFQWCSNMAELRDELLVFRKIKYPSWLDYNMTQLLKGMLHFDPTLRSDIKEIKDIVSRLISYERDFEIKNPPTS